VFIVSSLGMNWFFENKLSGAGLGVKRKLADYCLDC